jgi:hypothetical protein
VSRQSGSTFLSLNIASVETLLSGLGFVPEVRFHWIRVAEDVIQGVGLPSSKFGGRYLEGGVLWPSLYEARYGESCPRPWKAGDMMIRERFDRLPTLDVWSLNELDLRIELRHHLEAKVIPWVELHSTIAGCLGDPDLFDWKQELRSLG